MSATATETLSEVVRELPGYQSGTLPDTRSRFARTWSGAPVPAGLLTLPGGVEPAAAVVLSRKSSPGPRAKVQTETYLVVVRPWDRLAGFVTDWVKPDGTAHRLTYDGRSVGCDCEGCSYGATARADLREAVEPTSAGCQKADAVPFLFALGVFPAVGRPMPAGAVEGEVSE